MKFHCRSLLFTLLITAVSASANAQTVNTSAGKVVGLAMADGSSIFYGIPYAEAPVGKLRWKPPVARKPWQGVLNATQPPHACVQADFGWNKGFLDKVDEDCLNISIRTPEASSSAKLPVLLYIHGGSNSVGGVGTMDSDGIHRQGVVVVKIQYRLGIFGFLSLEALNKETTYKASGNYALLDQIAALKWVKSNIANFGGDPQNITLTGNSSGALDTVFLTLSPLAKGLFQKAIVQAAAPGLPITLEQNVAIGNALLKRLALPENAQGLAQLRKLASNKILAAAQNLPVPEGVDPSFVWELQILDGYVMSHDYRAAYQQGAGQGIPVIIGSNTQELGADRAPQQGRALIDSAFGRQAQKAMDAYGYKGKQAPAADPLYGSVTTQVMTDMWFRCPAIKLADYMQAADIPVWRYDFGFGTPGSNQPPHHTSEMDYVYRAIPTDAQPNAWPPVQQYWVNFMRNGDPNGSGLVQWQRVDNKGSYLLLQASGISPQQRERGDICNLMYLDSPNPQAPIAAQPEQVQP